MAELGGIDAVHTTTTKPSKKKQNQYKNNSQQSKKKIKVVKNLKNQKKFIAEYEAEYNTVSKDLIASEMKKRKVMSIINIFSILMQDQACCKNLIFK